MKTLNIPTKTGTVLHGALFSERPADTVVIAITGIHSNFYSNPFITPSATPSASTALTLSTPKPEMPLAK
ncbi:hypothetical protein ACLSZC_03505 [Avibacterium avium]|uniref:hypothetical protein n=1 Tax=Avibacterium avium TaxID=751 RepID=UPI003BF7CEB8